jgi:hypothetical protein
MSKWIAVYALDDAHSIGGNASLLAKAKHINPSAGSDRGKKDRERRGRARHGRLVGGDSKLAEVGVYAGTAREVNYHFHTSHYSLLHNVIFLLSCFGCITSKKVADFTRKIVGVDLQLFEWERIQ